MAVRSAVFVGGLGDMVIAMYESDNYTRFDQLGPDDTGRVGFYTANPFVAELFDHHPNRHKITVEVRPLCFPIDEARMRAVGVDPADGWMPRSTPVIFHPSPADARILGEIPRSRYVIFSLSAGHQVRSIRAPIAQQAVAVARAAGYTVVLIGRSYNVRSEVGDWNRQEVVLDEQEGVVNLIDKLTVPGSLASLERAAGVFCCHSAICLASWYLNKPTYTLYPVGVTGQWDRPTHRRFWPGMNQERSWQSAFEAWNPDNFRLFVELLAS